MAIRRVSDLPNLLEVYPKAEIDKCILEVSYNNEGRLFQSFYVKAKDLIKKYLSDYEQDHTISFDANGGVGLMPSQIAVNGQPFTVPNCVFQKEGSNFVNWKTTVSLVDYFYNPNDSFIMPNQNVVFVAQWSS